MKKKKLLTAVLSFMLVFSFLLSSSSMVLAEGTITADSVAEQENTDSSSEDTVLDEESNEEISNEDMLETGDTSSDDLNEEDVATDADAAEEESVEDRELIETIQPTFLRAAPRRANGNPGYIAWLTANQSQQYRHKLYVAVKGVTGTTEIAYCYNFDKALPGTKGDDVSKIANASAQDFQELVGKNSRLQGDQLKRKVLQICYEGYPKNSKNIQTEYNLSDDEFCLITQAAIWYYTDSKDVISPGGYFYTLDYYRPIVTKSNVKNAFNRLINTNAQLPSNYELDLYYPTNTSSRVQALLSTKLGGNTPKKHEFYLDKRTETDQGLQGATLQLLYSNGNLIKQWTSDGNARLFEAEAGSYIFRETHAPSGYDKASDIHFNIDSNGNVNVTSNNGSVEGNKKVVMVDRQSKPHITIRKVSPDGNALSGADLQILNSDGTKVIQQWTTDGNEKSIAIDAGDYIFRETKSPQGYDKVADFHFSVGQTGNITLKDTSLSYVKVEGNKLIITDSKEVPKTSRTVEKQWIDKGFENERPKSVQVQLYADGAEYSTPVTLSEQTGWKYTWDNLPKQKDGTDIEYTIKEKEVPGYHSLVEVLDNGNFRIQNSKLVDIVLSKEVTGTGGDKNKQFQFEVSLQYMYMIPLPLHAETIQIIPGVKPGYENECTEPDVSLWKYDTKTGIVSGTLSHGQQVTIKGILCNENVSYSIKELEANTDGYTTTYNGSENNASGKALQNIKVEVVNQKDGGLPSATGLSDHMNNSGLLIGISAIGLLIVALGYTLRLRKGMKR